MSEEIIREGGEEVGEEIDYYRFSIADEAKKTGPRKLVALTETVEYHQPVGVPEKVVLEGIRICKERGLLDQQRNFEALLGWKQRQGES